MVFNKYKIAYKIILYESIKGFKNRYPKRNFFKTKKNYKKINVYLWEYVDEENMRYESFETFGPFDNPWQTIPFTIKRRIKNESKDNFHELINSIKMINSEYTMYTKIDSFNLKEYLK